MKTWFGTIIISTALLHCARNRDIVDEPDRLIATPVTTKEMGGTSYTINYSRKQKKHRVIVYPDGSIGE